jgi:hypothetical protein
MPISTPKLLCLGRSLAVVLMRATLCLHLFELLFLVVAQQRLDLAVRVLHDGLHLGAAILLVERVVGAQSLHLLEAVSEDGLDLRHLIAGEAEPLSQMSGLPAGVEGAMLSGFSRSSRRIGIGRLSERESGARRKQNAQINGYL